jgi:Domain of unknown function (DUF1993)
MLPNFSWAPGKVMGGEDYLLQMTIPNTLFHVAMAYAILRHNGDFSSHSHFSAAFFACAWLRKNVFQPKTFEWRGVDLLCGRKP